MEPSDLIDRAAQAAGGLPALAEKVLYKERTLKRIRSGEFPLNDRLRQALVKVIEDSPVYGKPSQDNDVASTTVPDGEREIPLLNLVQGGPAVDFEMFAPEDVEKFKYGGRGKKVFALRLAGDSMAPKYEPGMILIVTADIAANNGDLVVATIKNEGSLFKIFHHSGDGKRVTLTSYNPAYPPLERPREAFHSILPVIEIRDVRKKL